MNKYLKTRTQLHTTNFKNYHYLNLKLTGLAMTSILDVILATLLRALPYSLKILLLTCNKSLLSIPGLRDFPPRNIPTSILLKRTSGSYPISIELTKV